MAFDDALEAAALSDADRIHEIANCKQRGADNITGFNILGEIAELANAFDRDSIEFFEMTEHRLGETLLFLVVKAKLDGFVSVGLNAFCTG